MGDNAEFNCSSSNGIGVRFHRGMCTDFLSELYVNGNIGNFFDDLRSKFDRGTLKVKGKYFRRVADMLIYIDYAYSSRC